MEKIKLGIIGVGNMGTGHGKTIIIKELCPEIELVAIADTNPAKLEAFKENITKDVVCFNTAEEMLDSGLINSCIVAIPHYDHCKYAMECIKRGIHVMVEKPAGVYTKQVREMNEFAAQHPEVVFGMMFNQRTNHVYRKLRELVHSGKFGEIRRVNWIVTNWYRSQMYYDSGDWRATWSGEGGGVLLNQCPHQLDLWQWICGMPEKITAVCHEGKWHNIEVEDDVMIYAEYPNGATGTFITTTGDYPGTNRLEITLDRAKLICENGKLIVNELKEPLSEFTKNSEEGFANIEYETFEAELDGRNIQHPEVMNKFAAAILRGEELVASGQEGINGLMISNAAFLSSWLGEKVSLPINEDLFYKMLQEKIANSTFVKEVKEVVNENMDSTY